ncbi:MAG: cysteine hydrolase [Rickettsiales bacterium]|jgi:nicotinamidase-related amidase|nr:cysteine hydrolase [Rickettsiales bacterium]
MNKILINICCWFIPKKKNKKHFREKYSHKKSIQKVIQNTTPLPQNLKTFVPNNLSFFNKEHNSQNMINLQLSVEQLKDDENGCGYWDRSDVFKKIPTEKTALLICDMWDKHWSNGATLRTGNLALKINDLANFLRKQNVLIIHSPSDCCKKYYANNQARLRASQNLNNYNDNKIVWQINKKSLPIDDTDGGSDSNNKKTEIVNDNVWQQQHPSIIIDDEKDIIADNGKEIRSYLKLKKIELVLFCGVHTNMCILGRNFGIYSMLERDYKTLLMEDYTDSMYNPNSPPYTSHDEGTKLVVSFIRKFVCPTAKIILPQI